MLEIKNGGYAVGDKWLIKNISYKFHPGKFHVICGPNGAGKSTLMKMLGLEIVPKEGSIFYNNHVANPNNKQEYSKYRAVLSQNVDISFPLNVEEVVLMGRYPHFYAHPSKTDFSICDEIMSLLGITKFRKRNFLTLSGGEKQRVQFARVLAQIWNVPENQNRILLLDEPIAAFDLKYQFEFLNFIKKIININTIVVAILHDLNMVLNYADEVLLLNNGNLYDYGEPCSVLSPHNINEIFNVKTLLHTLKQAKFLWPYAKGLEET